MRSDDWERISTEYGPLAWRAIFRILRNHTESLDCYQEVMLQAFEATQKQTIRNWPGFLRWLAVRRGLDRLRQLTRSRNNLDSSQDVGAICSNSPAIESGLEMEELKDRLRRELAALPDQQAEAFWMRFIEEMSYAEIASQMGIDSNFVGVLIHRARHRVRSALSDLQPSRVSPTEFSQ